MNCPNPNCAKKLTTYDFEIELNNIQNEITVWLHCLGCGYKSGRNLDEEDFEEEYV